MNNNYRVPTLAELYADDDKAYKDDEFTRLLNSDPPAHWIKTHKQTGIKYLPVDKVEILLDRIFIGRWRREILTVQLIVNAIQVTVRLWVFHPIRQEWTFHDGAGAMPIQLKSGSNPSDLANINHNAIQMNTPAAVSYALKDAADNLGKIFGRDVTRKDTVNYQPAFLSDPFANSLATGFEQPAPNQAIVQPPPPPPLPANLVAVPGIKENTAFGIDINAWREAAEKSAQTGQPIQNGNVPFAATLLADPGQNNVMNNKIDF